MNLGWYEIMDRISVIQSTLEDTVREHSESDDELKALIDSSQQILTRAYSYASCKFNDSCEGYNV